MLFKVQKKILKIEYSIDLCEYENNVLQVKGWLFSYKHPVEEMRIIIQSKGKKYPVEIYSGLKRLDVYKETGADNAMHSGFYGKIMIEALRDFSASLTFKSNKQYCEISLGDFTCDAEIDEQEAPHIWGIGTKNREMDLFNLLSEGETIKWSFPERFYQESIDIIIPIYNGYQYLEKLFETISLTKMSYRLLVINDNSPDLRVSAFLKEYAQGRDEVTVIENQQNLGFVKNVNLGLSMAKGHVVLVNSDVELPPMWLERLMLPILEYEDVASSTPYTNCGIITSFPEIGQDNQLFPDLTLEEIDLEFQKASPRYLSMPTGVGFCMAMSKKAIAEVGFFDADSFGMGYGEENDWCQRAIQKGYKNVHVENLFVYHKHGGSFLNEDKLRYMRENGKILEQRYPDYNKQIARFFSVDDNKEIRRKVQYWLIKKSKAKKTILAFDHDLGGGASAYLVNKRKELVEDGCVFYIVRYDVIQEFYRVTLYWGKNTYVFSLKTQKKLSRFLDSVNLDEIWINEIVTYPKLYNLLGMICKYGRQTQTDIKMLIHDYFCVCPTTYLLNTDNKFCKTGEHDSCKKCFAEQNITFGKEYVSIETWRHHWKEFLQQCSEITVFSESSREILECAYGDSLSVRVVPHQVGYVPALKKEYKRTKTLTIGLLGVLTDHKGSGIIKELTKIIEERKLPINIVLIGTNVDKIDSPVFSSTGKYMKYDIPKLTLKHDIDVYLVSSICPETFSYTTDEIIKMGMPVMCFNLGAPAERVSKYVKGTVLPETSAEAILQAVRDKKMIEGIKKLRLEQRKILFVVEEDSFASRYRVEHLREQLLFKGIASQRVMISQAKKCSLKEFQSVVIYRGSNVPMTQKLVKKAHRLGKRVYYNIDDYIFDYEKIKNLAFLQDKSYENFEQYSANVRNVMSLCDGYIASTVNMKKGIQESFPKKPVVINRNVASMGMRICSENERPRESDKIYIGYFSGTKTHNADFDSIKPYILKVMEENPQVYLLIAGQIELSREFDGVKKRIERFEFVPWTKLPHLIARADINLMPLEDTFFHACKSENKWMEAALVHVPTVATWNTELARVISHGENGFLCKKGADWLEALRMLVNDKDVRRNVAEKAYHKVVNEYTTFEMEQEVVDMMLK